MGLSPTPGNSRWYVAIGSFSYVVKVSDREAQSTGVLDIIHSTVADLGGGGVPTKRPPLFLANFRGAIKNCEIAPLVNIYRSTS